MSAQIDHVLAAKTPRELFGDITCDELEVMVRRLRVLVHPDHCDSEEERKQAEEASKKIADFHRQLTEVPKVIVRSKSAVYTIEGPLGDGMISKVHRCEDGWLLKVAKVPADRDLMDREWKIIEKLREAAMDSIFRRYLPVPLERFVLKDGGYHYPVHVFADDHDLYTLREIRDHFRNGIPLRHFAWMFNRLLEFLGFLQQQGITHGALLPDNVLVRPRDHGIVVIDWVAAGKTKVRAVDPQYEKWYPAEIINGETPHKPQTDLYMAGKLGVYALGGNPLDDDMPKSLPRGIVRVLRACTISSPNMRPTDAWRLQDDYREILEDIFGPPKFVEMDYPPGSAVNGE